MAPDTYLVSFKKSADSLSTAARLGEKGGKDYRKVTETMVDGLRIHKDEARSNHREDLLANDATWSQLPAKRSAGGNRSCVVREYGSS